MNLPAANRLAAVSDTTHRRAGIWSAPGRVNVIGEHTDYNEGFVLPFAIQQRTAVSVAIRPDRILRVTSKQLNDSVEVSLDGLTADALEGWSAYPLGVAWALAEAGHDLSAVSGLDLMIDSDVPWGAGLSSSAALECAAAVAMREVWSIDTSLEKLARISQRAENVAVGAPTGIMDQSVSLMASAGRALFLDCRDLSTESIPFDLDAAGLTIVVMDTRVKHSHLTGGYAERRDSCEKAATTLGVATLRDVSLTELEAKRDTLDEQTFRRARHIVSENARVLETVDLLRRSGPKAIGKILVASHQSMRDDFEISCPELDCAVDTALEAGAIGARMTGGGFGGAAIALVDSQRADTLIHSVERAFEAAGYRAPHCFSVAPSRGAGRDAG